VPEGFCVRGAGQARWDASPGAFVLSVMNRGQSHAPFRHGLMPGQGLPAVGNLNAVAHLCALAFSFLFVAAGVGAITALYLRRRDLPWTWAFLGFFPVVLALGLMRVGLLGTEAAVLSLTSLMGLLLGALGWGFHIRIEDRRAGGDREAAARARRGLGDSL